VTLTTLNGSHHGCLDVLSHASKFVIHHECLTTSFLYSTKLFLLYFLAPLLLTNLPIHFISLFLLSLRCPYCSFPSIFCGLSNEGLTNNPIHAFDNTSDSPREDDVLTRVDRYPLMAYVDVMEHVVCLTLHFFRLYCPCTTKWILFDFIFPSLLSS
jgi:hypothetical protein